ncbi:hypothetical protein [Pedococcus sp. 5OH_020]|uniref:hypothetical protein n=1 Tax=Pedococcus sp. 5OH_020 TaxID=2989814 RepID=UPI0022E99FFF|nr:hypothetical protein [Pedococcus sp. 5OH_020]
MSDQEPTPTVGDEKSDNIPHESVRDLSKPDRRLEGSGENDDAPELNDDQVAALKEREEPAAVMDFGTAFSADPSDAEVGNEAGAPQTREPDTSLGREGGQRYEDYAGDKD